MASAKNRKLGKLNIDEMKKLINKKAGLQVAHRLDEADSAIGAAAHVAMHPPDGDVQIFRIPAFVLRYDRRQGQQLLQSRPRVVGGLDAKEGDPRSAQHAQHALPHIGSDLAEGSLLASDAHRVQRRGGRHMPPRRAARALAASPEQRAWRSWRTPASRTLGTARSMCGAKDGPAYAVRVLVAWRVTALEYGCVAGAEGNLL